METSNAILLASKQERKAHISSCFWSSYKYFYICQ